MKNSPPPTPGPILQPQHNLGFQYEISHPKSSSQPGAKLPITKSTQDRFNSNPGIPGPTHLQPQQAPPFDGTDVFMKIPTSSAR